MTATTTKASPEIEAALRARLDGVRLDSDDMLPKAGRKLTDSVFDLLEQGPPEIAEVAARLREVRDEAQTLRRGFRDATRAMARAERDAADREVDALVSGRAVKPSTEAVDRLADAVRMAERYAVVAGAYRRLYRDLTEAIIERGPAWYAEVTEGERAHQARLDAIAAELEEIHAEQQGTVLLRRYLDRALPVAPQRAVAPVAARSTDGTVRRREAARITRPLPSSVPGVPDVIRTTADGDVVDAATFFEAVRGMRAYAFGLDATAAPDWTAIHAAQRASVLEPADPLAEAV